MKPVSVWVLVGDPLGDDVTNSHYKTCHALNASGQIVERDCYETAPTLCEVAADEKCNERSEIYFRGNCYYVLGENEAEVAEEDAERKCVARGGHLASLGDWDETYAARLAVRNAGLPRVHLGMRYNVTADGKRAPGRGYDSTLFEFRFPENDESMYPWCKGEPRGETIVAGTSVVMHRTEGDSETCWGELPPPGNAAALCKRSLN